MKDFLKTWWTVILWAIIIAIFSTVLPAQKTINWKKKPVIDLGLSIKTKTDAYKIFAWPKLVGYSLVAFGGLKDGLVEGYEFDGRKSWERKRGVSHYSQRGSQSWRSVYIDGNPELGFKSKFHKWMGAWDWYHRNDDYRKIGYISGGIIIGINGYKVNTKLWHYAADFAIGWAVSATAKSVGMKFIRN